MQSPPPIPGPFEQITPFEPNTIRDWNHAPVVVKGWAYSLTWLSIVLFPLIVTGTCLVDKYSTGEKIGIGIIYFILWSINIFQNRMLKKGAPVAWTLQIILSGLGICGCPLGTIISVYILSNWFNPETKAWFGVR